MRAITLENHLEFDFPMKNGLMQQAVVIGDVDNDGHNELVIGNMSGDLYIFKGKEQWQKITGLGMITCVAIGDVLNCGRNALIVICGEGWCNIFYMPRPAGKLLFNDTLQSSKIECVHKQRIPPNTKVILLGDIDADGLIEMVLGLTDRVVRSYRWCNITSDDKTASLDSSHSPGKLVCLNKWESGHQIGGVTLQHDVDNSPMLLVSQPGGTFMRIRNIAAEVNEESEFTDSGSESIAASCVDYQLLGQSQMRNQNISTEIIGNIKSDQTNAMLYAVATLDGTIMLVKEEVIQWSIQVDHQIFTLYNLDVTSDGIDEIIACSWDGQTYILDQNKNSIRYQFESPVQAFCCGYYNIDQNNPAYACLVYVTFNNKIFLYYNMGISNIKSGKLPIEDIIKQNVSKELLEKDKVYFSDKKNQRKFIEKILYGGTY